MEKRARTGIRHTITVPMAPEAPTSRIIYKDGILNFGNKCARIGLLDKVP
jgi:hypothetical protein